MVRHPVNFEAEDGTFKVYDGYGTLIAVVVKQVPVSNGVVIQDLTINLAEYITNTINHHDEIYECLQLAFDLLDGEYYKPYDPWKIRRIKKILDKVYESQ